MCKKLRENNLPEVLLPVVAFFGNDVAAFAKAINRSPQAVYAWRNIPRLAAYDIEAATNGRFAAHKLNKNCMPNANNRGCSSNDA